MSQKVGTKLEPRCGDGVKGFLLTKIRKEKNALCIEAWREKAKIMDSSYTKLKTKKVRRKTKPEAQQKQ